MHLSHLVNHFLHLRSLKKLSSRRSVPAAKKVGTIAGTVALVPYASGQ